MKRTVQALAAVVVGAGMIALAPAPAVCGVDCAMGGTMIKAEIDKGKAIEWGKDHREVVVAGEDTDAWSVLVLSRTDKDIAILAAPDGVFFGVAGRGGQELDSRDIEKAFGKDLRKLQEAVRREVGDLRKAGAIKIEGSDVQTLSESVALGTPEKDREWALTTADCKGTDIDTSGLK